MVHVLLDKDERVESVLDVNIGENHTWNIAEQDGRHLVTFDEAEFDPARNLHDYVYDPGSGTFSYDPEEEAVEYVDLETGEVSRMTSADIDALVGEKVRNQVEAVLAEMAGDGKLDLMMPGGEVV